MEANSWKTSKRRCPFLTKVKVAFILQIMKEISHWFGDERETPLNRIIWEPSLRRWPVCRVSQRAWEENLGQTEEQGQSPWRRRKCDRCWGGVVSVAGAPWEITKEKTEWKAGSRQT